MMKLPYLFCCKLSALTKCFSYSVFLLMLCFNTSVSATEGTAEVTNDAAKTRLLVEVPFVELHSGPGIGYPVLHVVEKNEYITINVKRTGWIKVTDKRGNVGWLHQNDLLGLTRQGALLTQRELTREDYLARNYEIGVMYGDFDGADFYNLQATYILTDVFNAEISYGKALGVISDSDLIEVMLISQPFPELILTPYLGIGGGIIKTTPHSVLADSEERQNTLMNVAIGMKYHLARNFLIRAEYRHSLVLTDRDENEEIQVWKLGFSVFF